MIETYNGHPESEFKTFVQTCYAVVAKTEDIIEFKYQIFGSKYIDSRSGQPSDQFKV